MKRKPLSVSGGHGLGETRTEIMQRKKERYRGISQTKGWKWIGSSGSRFLSPASAKLCVHWFGILPLQQIQHLIWEDEAALNLKQFMAPLCCTLLINHIPPSFQQIRRAQQRRKLSLAIRRDSRHFWDRCPWNHHGNRQCVQEVICTAAVGSEVHDCWKLGVSWMAPLQDGHLATSSWSCEVNFPTEPHPHPRKQTVSKPPLPFCDGAF